MLIEKSKASNSIVNYANINLKYLNYLNINKTSQVKSNDIKIQYHVKLNLFN